MKTWHVVVCKIGREDEAEDNLGSQGFECYNPGIKVPKRVRGEDIIVKEALFPDYVFVKFDPQIQSARTINYTYGVQNLMKFGDVLATIDEKIIESLKAKFDNAPVFVAPAPDHSHKTGDKFTIDKGLFAGIEAIFVERDGEKRSIIMLRMLGTEQKIAVDNTVIC